jgi:hypothetical protein
MRLAPTLIGLGGHLRAGKDAVADHLVAEHGFIKIGMSDPLHEAMLALDPWVPLEIKLSRWRRWLYRVLYGREEEVYDFQRYSELTEAVGYVEAKKNPEVRRLLQKLGTEVGRQMFDENVWTTIMARKVDDLRGAGHPVVVTGLRFSNEVQAIQDLGGNTAWVHRPSLESGAGATHASENSVDENWFARTIVNDGTLDDLRDAADRLLEAVSAQ